MDLKQKTIENTFIVFAVSFVTRGLNILTKIVLVRLLLPEDFGLFAIALLIINTVSLFREMGIESALIYKKDDVEDAAHSAFIIISVIGIMMYTIIYFTAPYVATFYGEAEIAQIARISGLTVIFMALVSVPVTLFSKNLDFGKRLVPDVVSTITYSTVSIILAFKGWGVWSLVYGGFIASLVSLFAIWKISPYRPQLKFNRRIMSELFKYGGYLFAAQMIIFVLTNVDDAVVGKILGLTVLGYYTLAFSFANMPVTNISHIMGRVMFPTFSRINDNLPLLKKAFFKTVKYVSSLTIPLNVIILLLASEYVRFILGERWMNAVPVLRVLCLYAMLRSLNSSAGELFKATGQTKFIRDMSFLQLIVFVVFIVPVTRRFGLVGVGSLMVIKGIMAFILCLWRLIPTLNMTVREYFSVIKSQCIASGLAGIITLVAHSLINQTMSSMIVNTCLFGLIYALVMYRVDNDYYLEVKERVNDIMILINNQGRQWISK